MDNRKMIRINDEIKEQVASIIALEVNDPRLSPLVTVVRADTTSDLKYCKIFISVMGSDEEKKNSQIALKAAAGFIRKTLAKRIKIRNTPELTFVLDESLDHSFRIDQILKEVMPKES